MGELVLPAAWGTGHPTIMTVASCGNMLKKGYKNKTVAAMVHC